jgi:hypothetical protein
MQKMQIMDVAGIGFYQRKGGNFIVVGTLFRLKME